MDIGTVTVSDSFGSRNIAITDFVRSTFKDHRLCTVIRTEENTYVLAIENPSSTGRATIANIHLSEESMLALVSCVMIYYEHKGIDITQKFQELINSEKINYEFNE